jgi:hypothetical protein
MAATTNINLDIPNLLSPHGRLQVENLCHTSRLLGAALGKRQGHATTSIKMRKPE